MKSTVMTACAILLAAVSLPLFAAVPAGTAKPPSWRTSIELGAVVTTGNTNQRSFKFRLATHHNGPRMRHTIHIDEFRQSQDSVVSADKFYASYQGDLKLAEPNALFGRISYDRDEFSGYAYQEGITFGYARRLLKRDHMSLRGNLGAGERHSKFNDGTIDNEGILRIALKYKWHLSPTAVFVQRLSFESGSTNSISRSETSIQTTIVGNLAMKLAVSVKHQSNVPVNYKKTDTESSVTLVYSF